MSEGVRVAQLYGELKLDNSQFDKAAHSSGGAFSKLGSAVKAGALVAVAGIAVIAGVVAEGVKHFEEQAKTLRLLDAAWGDDAKAVQGWAEKNAFNLGVEDDNLEAAMTSYGRWAKNVGMSNEEAMASGEALATRAAEISAATGKSFDVVFAALQKGAQGSTKGLKEYGVSATTAAIQAEALSLGIWDGTGKLTDYQAATARVALTLQETTSFTQAAAEAHGTMAFKAAQMGVVMDGVYEAIGAVAVPLLTDAMSGLLAVVQGVGGWVTENLPAWQATFEGIFGGIGGAASGLGDVLNGLLTGAIAGFQAAFQWLATNVLPLVQASIQGFVSNLQSLGDMITTIVTKVAPSFTAIMSFISEDVAPKVSAALSFIATDVIPAVSGAFHDIAAVAGPLIGDALNWLTTTILPLLKSAFDLITDVVIPALGKAFGWVKANVLPAIVAALDFVSKNVLPALQKAFNWISDNVLPALGAAFNWIVTNVVPPVKAAIAFAFVSEHVIPALVEAFRVVIGFVQDNLPKVAAVAKTVFDGVKGAVDVIVPIIASIAKTVGDTVTSVGNFLAPVTATIFPALSTAAGLLGKGLGIVFDGIKTSVGIVVTVISTAADLIGRAWSGLTGIFNTVRDAIGGAVKSGFNFVIGLANGIIDAIDSIQIHIGRIGLDTPAGFIGVGPFNWDGLRIPNIRYLAAGTVDWPGGFAMVGERGPELAYLPRHAGVLPAGDTADMLRGRGQSGALIGQQINNINGSTPNEVEQQMGRALRRVALNARLGF